MNVVTTNNCQLKIKKIEEVAHPKRGKEYKLTLEVTGIDADGDNYIYKSQASAPLDLNPKVGQIIRSFSAIIKAYGMEGTTYFRIESLVKNGDSNVK